MREVYFVKPFGNDYSMGGAVLVDDRIKELISHISPLISVNLTELAPGLKFQIRGNKLLLLRVLIRMIFKGEPYNVSKFRFQKEEYGDLITELKRIIPKTSEIVSSGWISALALLDAGFTPKTHFAHNVEFMISRSYSNRILQFLNDWKKLQIYEIKMLKKYDQVYTLSDKDMNTLRKNEISNVEVFRIYRPENLKVKPRLSTPIRIGLLGSMHWPPNIEAFNSIADNLLPLLVRNSLVYSFIVAGQGSDKLKPRMNVTLLGAIENVNDFYNKIDLVVIPRIPSLVTGISVKALEALEYGKIVLGDSETMAPFMDSPLTKSFSDYEELLEIITALSAPKI